MNTYIEVMGWESSAGINDELASLYARESAMILGFDSMEITTEGIKEKGKTLLEKIKSAKEEAVKKIKEAAATAVIKLTLFVNTHEVAGDFVKFIGDVYNQTTKFISESAGAAKEFIMGIKTKDDSLIIKAKDLLADMIERYHSVTSDIAAKGAGALKGIKKYQTVQGNRKKMIKAGNQPQTSENDVKRIVQGAYKRAESNAKTWLQGIDQLWSEISRDTGDYPTSLVANAIQVFMNAFILYASIITTPVQVLVKMGVSFAATKDMY